MAKRGGHLASVSFTYPASTDPKPLLTTHTYRWTLDTEGQSVEITQFKSRFKQYWPSNYAAVMEMWAYLDDTTSPGQLSTPDIDYRINVKVRPVRTDTGKNFEITGAFIDKLRWSSSLDQVNSFYARIVGVYATTLNWT